MRVAPIRTSDDAERGAVAVMLVVMIGVLLGSAALAIDLGQHWAARRNIITATDAAALAAAGEYAEGGAGCPGIAEDYVSANDADAVLTRCEFEGDSLAGSVTVEAEADVPLLFAPVLGFESDRVVSSTTVGIGPPASVRGLRPFGLCMEADVFDLWLDRTRGYGPLRIPYGKSQPNDCGNRTPGNWGVLDLNGGANSNAETVDWVVGGYDGEVSAPSWLPGSPGAFSGSLPLGSIVGETFSVPLFDRTRGNGANTEFHVVGFARVVLNSYRATGAASNRYLDVTFVTGIVQGTCCGESGPDTGIRVIGICAVDPGASCPD